MNYWKLYQVVGYFDDGNYDIEYIAVAETKSIKEFFDLYKKFVKEKGKECIYRCYNENLEFIHDQYRIHKAPAFAYIYADPIIEDNEEKERQTVVRIAYDISCKNSKLKIEDIRLDVKYGLTKIGRPDKVKGILDLERIPKNKICKYITPADISFTRDIINDYINCDISDLSYAIHVIIKCLKFQRKIYKVFKSEMIPYIDLALDVLTLRSIEKQYSDSELKNLASIYNSALNFTNKVIKAYLDEGE